MSTYSYQDVSIALEGTGGAFTITGIAAEGITIEATEDKNNMLIGADGTGMNSLMANSASTVTIRLLKTSPSNSQLQSLLNLQTKRSSLHGRNTLTVRNSEGGDIITLTKVAFKRRPTITFASEGGINEWTFDAIRTAQTLGTGTPEA